MTQSFNEEVLVAVLNGTSVDGAPIRGVLHWHTNGRLCGTLRGLPPRMSCHLALTDRSAVRVVRTLAMISAPADGVSVHVDVASMCDLNQVVGCSLLVLPAQVQARALCDGVLGWTQLTPMAKM